MVLIGFELDVWTVGTAIAEGCVVLPDFASLESMPQNWQRTIGRPLARSNLIGAEPSPQTLPRTFGVLPHQAAEEMRSSGKLTLDLSDGALQKDVAHEGYPKRRSDDIGQ